MDKTGLGFVNRGRLW